MLYSFLNLSLYSILLFCDLLYFIKKKCYLGVARIKSEPIRYPIWRHLARKGSRRFAACLEKIRERTRGLPLPRVYIAAPPSHSILSNHPLTSSSLSVKEGNSKPLTRILRWRTQLPWKTKLKSKLLPFRPRSLNS